MPVRKIIEIDEEKCDGCGQCVIACAEGALEVVDGKARVANEVFCDGLGACIGECPQEALKIIEREAPDFDEEAAIAHVKGGTASHEGARDAEAACGCPSAQPMVLRSAAQHGSSEAEAPPMGMPPQLANWPVQWKLVQPASPSFKGAALLIAADCVPFAFRDFHGRFLAGKPVVIGCPKLDEQALYLDKLTALFREAAPRSVSIVIMEVPCCGGLVRLVQQAMEASGQTFPLDLTVISIQGEILRTEPLKS
jgi:ferredoxin